MSEFINQAIDPERIISRTDIEAHSKRGLTGIASIGHILEEFAQGSCGILEGHKSVMESMEDIITPTPKNEAMEKEALENFGTNDSHGDEAIRRSEASWFPRLENWNNNGFLP